MGKGGIRSCGRERVTIRFDNGRGGVGKFS